MASSCYFFPLHMMHMGIFLHGSAGRLPVIEHALVTTVNDLTCRLPTGNRNCTCMYHTARTIALASDIHWQVAIHDRYFSQHLGLLLFPTRGNTQNWGNMYSVTSCAQRWPPRTIPAWTSPCNFSALRYPLRLLSFSASELTLNYTTRLL